MKMHFGPGALCAATVICLMPVAAHALELNLEAGYQAQYTNNSELTNNNEIGEWIQSPELTLDVNDKGPSDDIDVNYRAYRDYHQKASSLDQTVVEGTARATWRAIADRLTFDASNVSTQTTINATGADVQSNLQVTNTAQAGSVLMFNGFANHQVQLGYRYTAVTTDQTNTDSRANSGTFAYIVPLDTSRQVRLNAIVSDVKFDESTASDYISRQGNLQYIAKGDQVDVNVSAGYTVFDLDQVPNTQGATGALTVDWRIIGGTTLSTALSRSIEQGAVNAQAGIPQLGQSYINNNSDLTEPYTIDRATLTLKTELGHNELTTSGYYSEQNYAGISRNQQTSGGTLGISRKLRPTVTARLFGEYSKTDFEDQGQRNDDLTGTFALDWTRWHYLTISTYTTYTRRNSNLSTAEYDEWTGTIRIMYTVLGRGR